MRQGGRCVGPCPGAGRTAGRPGRRRGPCRTAAAGRRSGGWRRVESGEKGDPSLRLVAIATARRPVSRETSERQPQPAPRRGGTCNEYEGEGGMGPHPVDRPFIRPWRGFWHGTTEPGGCAVHPRRGTGRPSLDARGTATGPGRCWTGPAGGVDEGAEVDLLVQRLRADATLHLAVILAPASSGTWTPGPRAWWQGTATCCWMPGRRRSLLARGRTPTRTRPVASMSCPAGGLRRPGPGGRPEGPPAPSKDHPQRAGVALAGPPRPRRAGCPRPDSCPCSTGAPSRPSTGNFRRWCTPWRNSSRPVRMQEDGRRVDDARDGAAGACGTGGPGSRASMPPPLPGTGRRQRDGRDPRGGRGGGFGRGAPQLAGPVEPAA